jgi:hypothetical protein
MGGAREGHGGQGRGKEGAREGHGKCKGGAREGHGIGRGMGGAREPASSSGADASGAEIVDAFMVWTAKATLAGEPTAIL